MADEQDELQSAQERRLRSAQAELQKRELLRRMLSPDAYERMMNVRLGNPELYEKVVQSLAYAVQSGRQMKKIEDNQLYSLLAQLTRRRETSIEYRSK